MHKRQITVAVVDDDPNILGSVRELLNANGFITEIFAQRRTDRLNNLDRLCVSAGYMGVQTAQSVACGLECGRYPMRIY